MRKFCPKSSGFTLIELLVVISIIGILFTVGLALYNDFNRRQIVVQSAKGLKDNLRLAQSKASAGEKDCSSVYCGGTPEGNCDLSSKALDGWYADFSTLQIYGKCEGITFGPQSFDIPSNILVSSSISPIQFRPMAGGVGITTEATICISGFGKFYRLRITPSGEIKDEGFQTSC